MTFTQLLGNVGYIGGAVMLCLAVLSIITVAVIVDKHRRFRSATQQSQDFKTAVSGGIAEALITTGMGIFVAIPAVVGFNHFTGKIDNFRVEMNRSSSQLVNCLFKVPERVARDGNARGVKEHETAYAVR